MRCSAFKVVGKDKPPSFRVIEEKAVNWMELVRRPYSATKQYHIKLLISVHGERVRSFVRYELTFSIFTLSYYL